MKNSKKGSTSVFLVFILTAMVSLTAAFIYAARESAIYGYSDGLFNLATRSVLSEFDLTLKERYGLFAFQSSGAETEADIRDYVTYSLQLEPNAELTDVEVSFGNHSLGNQEMFKNQILDYMKFAIAEDLLKKKKAETKTATAKDRTLRNRKIIEGLPSVLWKDSSIGLSDQIESLKSQLGSLGSIFDQTKEHYLIDRYIVTHFKNTVTDPTKEATFFESEVEYILEGDYSNSSNREQVRRGLVALRSALNAVYLYTDPEKRAETLAAAELLTPGPEAVLTQAVITATWSLAEAENDVCLLMEKRKPVVLFKDASSWATDLDSVLANAGKKGIDTGAERGIYYEDYLMLFLHFQDEHIKLARTMDLIQINLKGTYDGNFLIQTCSGGLNLKAKVNGKRYEYESRY